MIHSILQFPLANKVYVYNIEKEKIEGIVPVEKYIQDIKDSRLEMNYLFPNFDVENLEKDIIGEMEAADKYSISVEPESLEEIMRRDFCQVKEFLGKINAEGLTENNQKKLENLLSKSHKKLRESIERYVADYECNIGKIKEKKLGPIVKIITKYSQKISHSDYEKWIYESLANAKRSGEKIPAFNIQDVIDYFQEPINLK